MRITLLLVSLWVAGASAAAAQQTIVFVDGSRMAIQSYAIKGGTVQFTTTDGKLRSVPSSYVDLAATEEANGGGAPPQASAAPRAPAPVPTATTTSTPAQAGTPADGDGDPRAANRRARPRAKAGLLPPLPISARRRCGRTTSSK